MKLLVLAALAAATSSPQQFDLVCSGPVPAGEDTTLWGAPSTHLRVDLATMQWCEDPPQGVVATPCAVLHQIAEVQPGVIWFDKSTDAEDALHQMHYRVVDRETGKYTFVEQNRFGRTAKMGTCRPAQFTGFPQIKTKF
jgi:hypothetical protein